MEDDAEKRKAQEIIDAPLSVVSLAVQSENLLYYVSEGN